MDVSRLAGVTLTGIDGSDHRLGDLWADKPVVVAFLRHFG